MNARIDFSELTNGASEITGVYVANTYFPTSIDVGNGDSVTIEMTWNADGTMTAAVPVVERAWKFGDILAFSDRRTGTRSAIGRRILDRWTRRGILMPRGCRISFSTAISRCGQCRVSGWRSGPRITVWVCR